MKTLTAKVSEDLDARLAAIAKKRGEHKSGVVRDAIERLIATEIDVQAGSCLDLVRDLAGCIDGPEALSHNKAHMETYGI